MVWWWIPYAIQLVLAAGSYFLARSMAPDPQNAVAGKVRAPSAEEGGNIPVLFGTRTIASQNVIWYGDIRIVPIMSEGGKK